MLTEYEAQKLMREELRKSRQECAHEPGYMIAVALRGAVALLMIAGVALFGSNTDPDRNALSAGSQEPRRDHASLPVSARVLDASANGSTHVRESQPSILQQSGALPYRPQFQVDPHSKQVFDERRRRYIEAYPDSHVAREMGATARETDTVSDGGYFFYAGD